MKPVCWKRMASGSYVDINNLTLNDLSIDDVDCALNNIIRFNGHYKDQAPLTVAQHSHLCLLLAMELEPADKELHLAVFIHDFAETYIGDISTPVKKAMGERYYDFARPIERLVETKFLGYPMGEELHDRVKMYDLSALDIERRIMWSSQYGKDKWPDNPLDMGTVADKKLMFNRVKVGKTPLKMFWERLYNGD